MSFPWIEALFVINRSSCLPRHPRLAGCQSLRRSKNVLRAHLAQLALPQPNEQQLDHKKLQPAAELMANFTMDARIELALREEQEEFELPPATTAISACGNSRMPEAALLSAMVHSLVLCVPSPPGGAPGLVTLGNDS